MCHTASSLELPKCLYLDNSVEASARGKEYAGNSEEGRYSSAETSPKGEE